MLKTLAFLFLLFPLATLSAEINSKGYYVTAKKLNVRAYPSDQAEIVGKRIQRQRVYIEELSGEWARIERYDDITLPNGMKSSSWVLSKYLSTELPEQPKSKYETNAISEQIVRSTEDRGRYFLVYIEKAGANFVAITSRIGVDTKGYTKLEINCRNYKYRELGYTEGHIEYFSYNEDESGNWVDVIPDSSKYDTVEYVCGTRGH